MELQIASVPKKDCKGLNIKHRKFKTKKKQIRGGRKSEKIKKLRRGNGKQKWIAKQKNKKQKGSYKTERSKLETF